jgi:nucleoside-diphosphate-sugar epimerase
MLLEAGHRVTAVDQFYFGRDTLPPGGEPLRVVHEDIRQLPIDCFRDADAVIDLAAISNDPAGELDAEWTWQVNHAGRLRVAQLAKQAGVPMYLFPSSCSVYGFQDGVLDERSPVNPLTTYAKANYQGERDTLALADGAFCVVVIRQATVYGLSSRMRFDLAINGMVRGLLKTGKIPILRDGTQWRPFVHVQDTARAMLLLLDAPRDAIRGEVFNVGADEQNYQIMPLARMVAEAVGVEFQYEWYGLPDHRSYRVSFQKIRDTLGFAPRFTPREGAREIDDALRQNIVDPDDPRTITVSWYKQLREAGGFVRNRPAAR